MTVHSFQVGDRVLLRTTHPSEHGDQPKQTIGIVFAINEEGQLWVEYSDGRSELWNPDSVEKPDIIDWTVKDAQLAVKKSNIFNEKLKKVLTLIAEAAESGEGCICIGCEFEIVLNTLKSRGFQVDKFGNLYQVLWISKYP